MLTRIRTSAVLGVLCLAAWLPTPARGCSVPVFRFALERWPADAYTISVVHRGPLTPEQETLVAGLEKPGVANLRVRRVDVADPGDARAKAWLKLHGEGELPRLVAEYADLRESDLPAWTGPLSEASVRALVDSPLRQEIARRIIDGQSAVWVLLECGDVKKNEKAFDLLRTQLAAMPKVLKLPVPDDATAEEILSAPGRPLPRIDFSLLRLSRGTPAEAAFVSLLLHTEEDLPSFEEPLAFPIFGRGRALEALVGKGITEDNIRSSCAFIIGACSCEVKRINPGRDLLMAVDWDKAIGSGPDVPRKESGKSRKRKKETVKPAPPVVPASVPDEEATPEEDRAPVETPMSPARIAFYVLGVLAAVSLAVALRVLR